MKYYIVEREEYFLKREWWFQELRLCEYAWTLECLLLPDFVVFHSPILFVVEITIIAAEIGSEVKQHLHVAWRKDSTQGSRVPDSADMNSAHMGQLQSLCTFRLCNLTHQSCVR